MKIRNSVALVTGANRGLGLAYAKALLAAGARKVYAGARDPSSVPVLEGLVPVRLDVNNAGDIAAAVAQCGDIELLINNAGIIGDEPLLGENGVEALHNVLDTNLYGVLAMSRAFAPVLRANGGGAIANLVSGHAQANLPLMGSFCASKAALLSLTQALRAELAQQGTHVLAVLPGLIDTDSVRSLGLPKTAPAYVARSLVQGLKLRLEEVYPGDMAGGIAYGAVNDPKAAEKRFAGHLSK